MTPLQRTPAPDFLLQHWEEWGKLWQKKLVENPKASFPYPQVQGQGKEQIREQLFAMSAEHCAFCDALNAQETIEHFKPKKQFPLVAYQWENLYPCCGDCQGKNDRYSDALLRPDADDYSFRRYFILDFPTFELCPNPEAEASDQERAKITIELYRLNRPTAKKSRKLSWKNFRLLLAHDNNLDDLPFRYLADFIS